MKRIIEAAIFYFRLFGMLVWLIIASAIAFPLALLRWKSADNNYFFGKIYGGVARAIMGVRMRVEGVENLAGRPAILAVNHQSGMDLAMQASVYPRHTVIIAKKEIRRIPVFGLMFEAFGNILIDRHDRVNSLAGLNQAVAEMKRKRLSVWIFPEGTRNASGEGLLPFKKGAFYMAIQSGTPVIPIVCSRLERLVHFERRYARSGNMVIRVLPPIPTTGMTIADVDRLGEMTRTRMLAALIEVSAKAEAMDGHSPIRRDLP